MTEIRKETITIDGKDYNARLEYFTDADLPNLQTIYQSFMSLRQTIKDFGDKNHRGPNIPETLTEGAFALFHGSPRLYSLGGKSSASFDNFDVRTNERIQVKAMSATGPTSFGPKSVFDKLYFLDFLRDGSRDGKFDVYDIPLELVYDVSVNRNQTLAEQQLEARRPRFRMMQDVIQPNELEPTITYDIMSN